MRSITLTKQASVIIVFENQQERQRYADQIAEHHKPAPVSAPRFRQFDDPSGFPAGELRVQHLLKDITFDFTPKKAAPAKPTIPTGPTSLSQIAGSRPVIPPGIPVKTLTPPVQPPVAVPVETTGSKVEKVMTGHPVSTPANPPGIPASTPAAPQPHKEAGEGEKGQESKVSTPPEEKKPESTK